MKVLITEISSIINSTFDCPFHSFRDNFPAILNVLLFFLIKYPPKSLSTALKAIDFIVVPSLPIKTDLICFSPTIFPLIVFTFSIMNLGSGFPFTQTQGFYENLTFKEYREKGLKEGFLTEEEAKILRNDSRIESVEIHPEQDKKIIISNFSKQTGKFYRYKSSDRDASDTINWGLRRMNENTNIFDGNTEVSGDFLYSLDGTGVDIVIQDSGIEANHPEWEDAEGNSRLQQINWYTESGYSGTQHSNFYSDKSGHGTHVAGIAAGKTYGWAKNAHIFSQKLDVLKGYGDTSTGISTVNAFDMIRLWHNNKTNGRPTVVNMSWGSSYSLEGPVTSIKYRGITYAGASDTAMWDNYGLVSSMYGYYNIPAPSTTYRVELEEMIDAGIHIVIAAGNSYFKSDVVGGIDYNNRAIFNDYPGYSFYYHRQGSPESPLAFNVGNIDSAQWDLSGNDYSENVTNSGPTILDIRSFSSVCGPAVDIWAPGTNITSACSTISEMSIMSYPYNTNFKITTITGTSMAAPQICGLCALYLQSEPTLTPTKLKQKILNDSKVVVMDTTNSGDNPIYRHPKCTNGSSNNMVYNRYCKQQPWSITKS